MWLFFVLTQLQSKNIPTQKIMLASVAYLIQYFNLPFLNLLVKNVSHFKWRRNISKLY